MSRLFERVEVEKSVNGKRLNILLTDKEKVMIMELKLIQLNVYATLEQIVKNQYNALAGNQYTHNITRFLALHLSKEGQRSIILFSE